MDGVVVSLMSMEDLEGVVEIEKASFAIPWSWQAFVQELKNNRFAHYLTAKLGDEVIAYGGMWFVLDEAHITNIAVHPGYRSKGIGSLLLEEMIRYAVDKGIESFTLEVRASNYTALRLYKKKGFLEAGVRKGYYSDNNEDAVIMWKRV
ncbi:MAG: Ribosomal-protein-S18p-alanine acetyltransferase [Firmicutes bacterium]|nr:Ribosomal-protein-S18p-alanine acetyltransferase [Bacillota bacterium]MDI6706126.1 ribosomal protein S18-alanine N-acetyltransferase [Bacillota bacterium]